MEKTQNEEYAILAELARKQYENNQDYLSFKKGDVVEVLELGLFLQSTIRQFKSYIQLENMPLVIKKIQKKRNPVVFFETGPYDAKLFKKIH